MCYVFSVVSYGCETWTFSRAIDHKINSSVLRTICVKETTMLNDLKTAGHIMTNTSGHRDTLLATIEGIREGKRGRRRPRRTWVDDLRDWIGSKLYDQMKRAAETRNLHGTLNE